MSEEPDVNTSEAPPAQVPATPPPEPDETGGDDGHEVVLRLTDVVKTFPGVRALDGVQLEVRAGEVHCLLGQNGAGKSTLIKVLAGVHHADSGEVIWLGEQFAPATTQAAMRAGSATRGRRCRSWPRACRCRGYRPGTAAG